MSILNARMYSVSAAAAAEWRVLLEGLAAQAGLDMRFVEHPAPAPLADLWQADMGAVFMCGLPFARAHPQPWLIAAPVPSPAEFGDEPRYWSEFVVRRDSGLRTIEATYGKRIAFTVPDSQSGCAAALTFLQEAGGARPLFAELIAPTISPLGALQSVIDRSAEVAPIDAYALRLLEVYRPELTAQVQTIARTGPTPIPVLAASQPQPALRAAFLGAHRIPTLRASMIKLLLNRFVPVPAASYAVLGSGLDAARHYWAASPFAAKSHPAFRGLTSSEP